MAKTQILHLSDLHVTLKEDYDRRVVLDPLIKRVKEDRESDFDPEIVVVSGDIAFQGIVAEYEMAEVFFRDLLKALDLPRERLFLVPGNHDVNRKKYRPSDVPRYETMQQLNAELGDPEYRAELLKGMGPYFDYVEDRYPHLMPLEGRLVPFVVRYPANCGRTLQIVGLNSAWMCRRSQDKEIIAIGDWQIRKAVETVGLKGPCDLRVFLFHHPLQWLWLKDQNRCKPFLDNSLILCGHLHEPAGGLFQEMDGGAYHLVQAGGAYTGSESAWPSRYHYITLDWEKGSIRLDFRSFDKSTGRWSLDGAAGKDGKAVFRMLRPHSGDETGGRAAPLSTEIPENYCRWVEGNCGTMEADKLYGKGQAFPLHLPDIFIPLYTNDPDVPMKKVDPTDARQAPVDIETLIARHDFLLIEGQAGSGKTTLLKHLACTLSGNSRTDGPPEGLEGYLPVLILLKHVEAFFRFWESTGRTGATAKDALDWYFDKQMENLLSFEILDPFLTAGKVIFLVDGLDEIRTANRNIMVHALDNLIIKHNKNRIVLAGRPHGMEGAVVDRYFSRHIRINSLTLEQINQFIQNWFDYLYPGPFSVGSKNAEAMIAGIKSHPATSELVDNPLMLTAVCILYHDNKELPDQRVELYKKFVDNLLYRRFDDPELVHQFLARLAHRMHAERARAVDRVFALEVLKESHKIKPKETDEEYARRLVRIFDDIEPRCGLLRMEGGQYAFWHLTFQEFLTAVHLADTRSDFIRAVEPFWSEDWYKEVVELYIGYLSMNNKQTANEIVAAGMAPGDEAPFKRWRLAGRALLDIPVKRRDEKVIEVAQQRLREVFETGAEPTALADAGEILGRLGDPRDLCAFVSIPGGTYKFKERGKVEIELFEIGKYPVTNSWFAEFIQAGGYDQPDLWSAEGRKWLGHTGEKQPRYWDDRRWNCLNAPVMGVCWYESDAFCRWLTRSRNDGWIYRLPDENQWQAAAAGKEGREYPWGDIDTDKNWKEGYCNTRDSNIGRTSAVGIFKAGNTPKGEEVADLAGNVWEWTLSDYHSKKRFIDFPFDEEIYSLWKGADKTRDQKKIDLYFEKLKEKKRKLPVLRGGSWAYAHELARCSYRCDIYPGSRDTDIGFRCVRTLK
ncbi:MAG: SUMF1/EgtB/PvdO family nonheme iron enzyme [Pseudomonadota bacterium]